jgi:hypothetical protein
LIRAAQTLGTDQLARRRELLAKFIMKAMCALMSCAGQLAIW